MSKALHWRPTRTNERTQLTRLKALFTTDEVLRKGVYTDKMYSSVTRRAEAKTLAEAEEWQEYKNDVRNFENNLDRVLTVKSAQLYPLYQKSHPRGSVYSAPYVAPPSHFGWGLNPI